MVKAYVILAIVLAAGTFAISAGLTWLVMRRSLKTDFVARPKKDRFHQSVIPLGGGVAIFWSIAIVLLGGILFVKFLVVPGHVSFLPDSVAIHAEGFLTKIPHLLIILGAALCLHLLGLWDDKKHLGPAFKLVAQFAVAITVAFFADVRVELFIDNKFITSAMSAFWIVLLINSFNFLDNMDGLSVGIAAIASSVMFTAAAVSGQVFIGALAIVFVGALLGFLVFNFPPAKIFMGDCGSLVIGFFVALLSLRTTYYHESAGGSLYSIFMPLIIMAVPLYDFISVTILRISQGKSPFVGDTQHFSHRMKRRGLSDMQTALTLYLATLCTGIGAIFLFQVDLLGAVLIFAQTIMILAIIAIMEATG